MGVNKTLYSEFSLRGQGQHYGGGFGGHYSEEGDYAKKRRKRQVAPGLQAQSGSLLSAQHGGHLSAQHEGHLSAQHEGHLSAQHGGHLSAQERQGFLADVDSGFGNYDQVETQLLTVNC